MAKLFPSPIQKCSVHSGPEVQRSFDSRSARVHSGPEVQPQRKMSKLFPSPFQKCSVHSFPEVQRQQKMLKLFLSPIQKCSVHFCVEKIFSKKKKISSRTAAERKTRQIPVEKIEKLFSRPE
jgi:hypothetical protein